MTKAGHRAAGHLRCPICDGLAVVTRTSAETVAVRRERKCLQCASLVFTEEKVVGTRVYCPGGQVPVRTPQIEETEI